MNSIPGRGVFTRAKEQLSTHKLAPVPASCERAENDFAPRKKKSELQQICAINARAGSRWARHTTTTA